MKQKDKAIIELELRSISKFGVDELVLYPGLENEKIKDKVNDLINRCIDDFIILVQRSSAKKDFQQAISRGLSYFETLGYNLDTEDRERVCGYFEEIMDAVGLESSGGILNEWMYGFDITKTGTSHDLA